jgi:hypothetical protein
MRKAVLIVAIASVACAAPPLRAADRQASIAEQERIDAEYRAAKERCDRATGAEQDVCAAAARAARRIAKAEADARAKDTPKAWYDARIARAEAEFLVARERCAAVAARDACLGEARAAEARAKAEAEHLRRAAEARGESHPKSTGGS